MAMGSYQIRTATITQECICLFAHEPAKFFVKQEKRTGIERMGLFKTAEPLLGVWVCCGFVNGIGPLFA